MKINLTKADEQAINDGIVAVRQNIKRGALTKHSGQKVINGLKKILEKHEVRKSKEY